MSNGDQTAQPEDDVRGHPVRWDSAAIMRQRADGTRADRDDVINALRRSMTDDEALDEFGIDLGEIEK